MRIKDLVGFLNPTTYVLLYQMSINEPFVRENIYHGPFGKVPRSMREFYLHDISIVKYSSGSVLDMFVEGVHLRKR